MNDAASHVDNIHSCAEFLSILLKANIQFDVIPAGQFHQFHLKKYRLISATHAQCLSNNVLDALSAYVQSGGILLASARAGSSKPGAENSSVHSLLSVEANTDDGCDRYLKSAGAGTVITHKNAEFNIDMKLPINCVKAVLADIQRFNSPSTIEVQAPEGVVALLWGKGTKRWVHVLNYRKNISHATVVLPGCGGRKIAVYSPDESQPELNVLDSGAAKVSFSLNGIDTYAIVEID